MPRLAGLVSWESRSIVLTIEVGNWANSISRPTKVFAHPTMHTDLNNLGQGAFVGRLNQDIQILSLSTFSAH